MIKWVSSRFPIHNQMVISIQFSTNFVNWVNWVVLNGIKNITMPPNRTEIIIRSSKKFTYDLSIQIYNSDSNLILFLVLTGEDLLAQKKHMLVDFSHSLVYFFAFFPIPISQSPHSIFTVVALPSFCVCVCSVLCFLLVGVQKCDCCHYLYLKY